MSHCADRPSYTTVAQAREQGRQAAIAGREIWCNPHTGGDAEAWFAGYREVSDVARGTRPDLRPQSVVDGAVVRQTRRPLSTRRAHELRALINYHEAVLRDSTSADRRARSERQLTKLRSEVPYAPTPRPWSER